MTPAKRFKKARITLEQLQMKLKSADAFERSTALDEFPLSAVTVEAVPCLHRALFDTDFCVRRLAAQRLGVLGPAALLPAPRPDHPLVQDLVYAAKRHNEVELPAQGGFVRRAIVGLPGAYEDCLIALVKIAPQDSSIMALIQDHVGLGNWIPISASMKALKTIGTPAALALLDRMVAFWMPELNKQQKKWVQEIRDGKQKIE